MYPIFSALAAGMHNEDGLMSVANCAGNVTKSFNKDSEYITKLFVRRMQRLCPEKGVLTLLSPLQCVISTFRFDMCVFDGASNV